jgi:acyl-CoA-binding protein
MSQADADLHSRFEQAVAASKSLPERPDNATLLQLYALFKQASEGDLADPKPNALDFVGTAKWNARDQLRGVDAAEAMRRYIARIGELQG